MFRILDPVGKPAEGSTRQRRSLDSLHGKRLGLIWNRYGSTKRFWPMLEAGIERLYGAASVERIYKDNTWSPAAADKMKALLDRVDFLVVGVGA